MPSLIEDLIAPSNLPDPTDSVTLVQTHISLVFIADRFVYKIKKPVDFGFLDFTTLDKRRHYCEQEVRLNSRLSEGLYIGVLPVTFDGERHKIGETDGEEIVDYAVMMKRIPDETLMDKLFEKGLLTDEHLRVIAAKLADFHEKAEKSPEIDRYGLPEVFRVNTDENFEQTEKYIGLTIDKADFELLKQYTADFYESQRPLFLDRIEQGKIRDCHGDLHMDHVSITDEVQILDCIEFNDRFRYSDTLLDLAFLLMDIELAGGVDHSEKLCRYYQERTGDKDIDILLTFYKVYRAYVRGKVTSFQLDDERIDQNKKDRAAETAERYFNLAKAYVQGRS